MLFQNFRVINIYSRILDKQSKYNEIRYAEGLVRELGKNNYNKNIDSEEYFVGNTITEHLIGSNVKFYYHDDNEKTLRWIETNKVKKSDRFCLWQ